MPDTLQIVPVFEHDLDELVELSRSTFIDAFAHLNTKEDITQYLDENLSIEKLTQEFINPHTEFYFAKVGSETVGYLKINTGSAQNELKDENCMELERIYIKKEFQGNHFGASLLSFVLHEAEIQEVDFVWLGVWEKNHGALRFYQKHGFTQFDSHDFKLGKDIQTDLMMKKEISVRPSRI